MTRSELIWDVKILLSAAGITDESRIDDDYVGAKIDQKRSKEIRDAYKRNPIIEPVWLQDYGVFSLTRVNKVEDRTISTVNHHFSKAVLPPVVSISDPMSNNADLGVYRISSASGADEYHYKTMGKLSLMNKDSIYSKMKYYTRVFNSVYLTPEIDKARAVLIQEHPLQGYVLDNTDYLSGTLVNGTSYEVRSGNITYNSVKYYKGNTFTATATTTFTGSGKVYLTNQKRAMTNDDQYPMSSTMAEMVILKLLTQDYKIEAQRYSDITNDSKDQFKTIQG